MKKIIIALFCLSTLTLSAQKTGADAEYLKLVKEYTLNDDGSIDFHKTKSIKLLSHYAFHRLYGETFIIYNTDYQTLKINSSYTIMADGKKITTPNNAYNEVLPRYANNAPAYNHIREMVVTHTGLEVGATINLDYNIHSEPGFYPALMAEETLEYSSPVKELVIKVNIPESKSLNYGLLNIEGKPVTSTNGGVKSYIWTFTNLAASSKDNYQGNHSETPKLIFSTIDNETAVSMFLDQEAFNYMTNEKMVKVVNDVLEKESNKLNIALKLQGIVANSLSNLNIPLETTGFRFRNSIQTWNSNQGTEVEKAILLTSLLHKAGIHSEPVASIPISNFNKEIGNMLAFNHFLVKVYIKGHGELYLSANKTDKQNQYYALGGKALQLFDKSRKKAKVILNKPTTGQINMSANFDLKDTKKLLGTVDVKLSNISNPYFSYLYDSANVKKSVSGLSGKAISGFIISKLSSEKSEFSLEINKSNPVSKFGDYYKLTLPKSLNGVDSWNMNLLTESRNSQVELPQLIEEKYEFTYVLKDGVKLITKPVMSILSYDFGSVTIIIELKGNEVIVKREISFKKTHITVLEYSQFKKMMDLWNTSMHRELVFK